MSNARPARNVATTLNPWDWVTATPRCTDALIAPLWPQISKLLEPSFQEATFDTNFRADDFNILYTVAQDGTLTWHRHMMRFPGGRINHSFNPPKTVGTGWAGGYKDVMPMG